MPGVFVGFDAAHAERVTAINLDAVVALHGHHSICLDWATLGRPVKVRTARLYRMTERLAAVLE